MTCLFSAMHRRAASQQEQHCFVPSASETEETVPDSVEIKSNLLFLLFAALVKTVLTLIHQKILFSFQATIVLAFSSESAPEGRQLSALCLMCCCPDDGCTKSSSHASSCWKTPFSIKPSG